MRIIFFLVWLLILSVPIAHTQNVDLLDQVNTERQAVDLPPLEQHPLLDAVAASITAQKIADPDSQVSIKDVNSMVSEAGFSASWVKFESWVDSTIQADIIDWALRRYDDFLLSEYGTHIGFGVTQQDNSQIVTIIIAGANFCLPSEQEEVEEVQKAQGERFLELTNQHRAEYALSPLSLNLAELYQGARRLSLQGQTDLVLTGQELLDHIRSEGYIPATILDGHTLVFSLDADGVFNVWWNDPETRAILLSDGITEMALAFSCDEKTGEFYYAHIFARPLDISEVEAFPQQLFERINTVRNNADLSPLTNNPILTQFAQETGQYIVEHGIVSRTMWDDLGKRYTWQEIDALFTSSDESPQEIVNHWLMEDGDRILDPVFTEIGIAVVLDETQHLFQYVLFLALPMSTQDDDSRSQELLGLINTAREDAGLQPLVSNPVLTQFAQENVNYLIEHNALPDTFWDDLEEYYDWEDAEAFATANRSTAQDTINVWVDRYADRILQPEVTEIGFGIVLNETDNRYYYVVIVASPAVNQVIQPASNPDINFLELVNNTRQTAGLMPLESQSVLDETAEAIAARFAANTSDSLSQGEVKTMLSRAGFQVIETGFARWSDDNGVDEAVQYALQHYDVLLLNEQITHVGFGVTQKGNTRTYAIIVVIANFCLPSEQEEVFEVQKAQGERVLELVNQRRAENGLPPLTLNVTALYQAALWYSNDMKLHGYPTKRPGGVAHVGTDNSTAQDRALREGYYPSVIRENIKSQFTLDADLAVDDWWHSPGHKANILGNDVTEMGLAFTCNTNTGEFFYTQVFAHPLQEIVTDSHPQALAEAEINETDCYIVADGTVNLRRGPGTSFSVISQLVDGQMVQVESYDISTSNFRWWRLTNGGWVRDDVVDREGNCADIPHVDEVQASAESPIATTASENGNNVLGIERGAMAQIAGLAPDLPVRTSPSMAATITQNLPRATIVIIIGGPEVSVTETQPREDFTWWQVRTEDGVEGWVTEFMFDEPSLIRLSAANPLQPVTCVLTTLQGATIRSGPGARYEQVASRTVNQLLAANGKFTGRNRVWWQILDGFWIREDLVSESDGCASLPEVPSP